MKIIEPYAHIMGEFSNADGIEMLKSIEYIARISHRTEDRVTEDSYDRFLRSVVLQHGDFSVIEHASVTVEAEVDRGITHEWVRHRLGAYTQESTRFVNYTKGGQEPRFVLPVVDSDWQRGVLGQAFTEAGAAYKALLEDGQPPQIARSVLPNALASKIIVTYNLRMWRHFLLMRTCREAHPQMKQVTIPLLEEFQAKIPIIFEDIVPGTKQAEAMKQLR